MSKQSISHKIKHRDKPNDVFYTPGPLVDTHIQFVRDLIHDGIIYEPFLGGGAYTDGFSRNGLSNPVVWSEIEKGADFFEHNECVDYIISNPPYSIIDIVLEKSVSLNPAFISYLIGVNNLTARRLETMRGYGYYLARVKLLKVFAWYGMSYICVWVKGDGMDCIQFDRVVYK